MWLTPETYRVNCLVTLEGGSCTVPEAVVTVLSIPDDGCCWHPKHVQRTCRIINRLLCVALRWTIINIPFSYSATARQSIRLTGIIAELTVNRLFVCLCLFYGCCLLSFAFCACVVPLLLLATWKRIQPVRNIWIIRSFINSSWIIGPFINNSWIIGAFRNNSWIIRAFINSSWIIGPFINNSWIIGAFRTTVELFARS